MKCIFASVLFFVLSAVLPAAAAPMEGSETLRDAMAKQIPCFPHELITFEKQEISISREDLCLAATYSAMGETTLWVTEEGPGEKAAILLHVLEQADSEGLEPHDYDVATIRLLWDNRSLDALARLDSLLTLNLIKYGHDVSRGRIKALQADPVLFAEAGDESYKVVEFVRRAFVAPDFSAYLRSLPPAHHYYRGLRTTLQQFRRTAAQGGWPAIPGGKSIRPGDRDPRLSKVRTRLALAGLQLPDSTDEELYDDLLVPVVKTFQVRFGLKNDGIIGRNSLAAMNIPVQELVATIILNMARWRWQEPVLGDDHIIVNIANYNLKAVRNGEEELSMAVIVGRFKHQTPVFSHRIKYLDFNPFWNIPPEITWNEERKELQKDPDYLTKHNIRLFSSWQADAVELDPATVDWHGVSKNEMGRFKLRQDPGPWNALGRVKFVFPNPYDVYLHDTSAHDLFKHTVRGFSHGCIRVSQPLDLASFVLSMDDASWTMEKIQTIIEKEERKVVRLERPLPIHITYQTAWLDKQERIHFNRDIYKRDKKLAEVLFQ